MISFFEDPLKVTIVLAVGVTLLYQLYKFIRKASQVEHYEDSSKTPKDELQEILIFCDKVLCSPLKEIREALQQAEKTIEQDAEGAVYDCNMSKKDMFMIPADIDKILQRTLYYVEKRVVEMLQKNKDALTCKKEESFTDINSVYLENTDVEGFEATPNPKLCTAEVADAKRKEVEKQTVCILPEQISPGQKEIIIKNRLLKITQLLSDLKIQATITNIQTQYDELTSLKEKMKDGSVRPQCGEL